MPSDDANSSLAAAPIDASLADETLHQAVPMNTIDSLLQSVLAGAQARVRSDLERAREAGLIDAEGRVVADRWPDDMRADSRTSVETG